jgi:hypothetical protein
MIVCAEASSCTEITEFFGRGQAAGRLSVDVAVDPPVDLLGIRDTGTRGVFAAIRRYPRRETYAF